MKTFFDRKNILLILILFFGLFLRVWRMDAVPVSLFGDEVDIGYQAYSLLNTGKDYLGNFLPITLHSLADYKAGIYAYSIIPTIAIFGISPYGVRLPAALFGVLEIFLIYKIVEILFKNRSLALLAAFLLAITPWHIHYSRWGFEGNEMLVLFSAGLICFLKGLENYKWLVPAAIFFALDPASYHSAKVFIPLILLSIVIIYFRNIKMIPRKNILISFIVFCIIILPIIFSTFFGGGTNRFEATSIFKDPTVEGQIGQLRTQDSNERALGSKLFHNRITHFGSLLLNNYLEAYSTEFLFIKGDPEPTHTPTNTGEFYLFEAPFLILGIIYLFQKTNNPKAKVLLVCWLMLAPIASIATDHGGFHASRLLFLLPVIDILIAIGIYYNPLNKYKKAFIAPFLIIVFISFVFFEHNYWVHYPFDSERWWHSGFEQAIQSAVSEGQKYNKVIISGADEPPLIFFLGWSQFSPAEFQKKYPLAKENIPGIGEVDKLDKYDFTPIGKEIGLYELGKLLPPKTLYLATAKEIKLDLIKEPNRVPNDLVLIKSILYPSGEGAFYLFTKNEKNKST